MIRLAVLALACSDYGYVMHAPSLDGCTRVAVAEYTAGAGECVKLSDVNGKTLFKAGTSESCGGPPCVGLQPGETGYALEKAKPGERAEWSVERGPCETVMRCCGDYLGEWQCW